MLSSSPSSSLAHPNNIKVEVIWHLRVRVPPSLIDVAVPRRSAFALTGSYRSVRTFLRSTTTGWDKCACFRLDGLGCKAVGWQCNEGETVMCCTSVRSRFRYKLLGESHEPCMDTWHSLVASILPDTGRSPPGDNALGPNTFSLSLLFCRNAVLVRLRAPAAMDHCRTELSQRSANGNTAWKHGSNSWASKSIMA
jgi:hypothetical protein